jgi:hypothetical protein
VFAAKDSEIADGDIEMNGQGEIAEMLSGTSYDDARDLLEATRPYDAAAANWDLLPEERFAAVQDAQAMDAATP